MRNSTWALALLVAAIQTVLGCDYPKKEQCASDDSPALCKEVQKCFQSGTSTVVCREGEKDAKSVESNKQYP
jgi:uncharacterized protein YgiB involved in biofilm formation